METSPSVEPEPTVEDDPSSPTGPDGAGQVAGTVAPASAIDAVDRLLDEVERALRRLDDGSYGSCVGCGAAIDDDRLARTPTAEDCSDCAAEPASRP